MTLRILQLTDCHLFVDPKAELKEICTRDRLERVLATLPPEFDRVDRLIITGDLTHDDLPETYGAVRSLFDSWWPRVRLVPGNHDVRDGLYLHCGDRVERVAERIVFRETLGNWKLIGLDSHWPGEVRGELGTAQLEWLDGELSAGASTPTALFLHHPPILAGSAWMNEVGLVDREAFWSVIERHPQVRVICAGHVHHELTTYRHGVLVLTTPSTGVQFVPESEQFQIDVAEPGYRILELEEDGTVRTRVVRVSLYA